MAFLPFLQHFTIFIFFGIAIGKLKKSETVSEQTLKWHVACEKFTSSTNGGGLAFRQCMKEHRANARREHAQNLRTSLAEELSAFRERQIAQKREKMKQQWDGRPNILLITTDQQRQDSLGCYTKKSIFHAKTPHVDRLAEEGMLVLDAWSASPVCSPSRTSLLLGVHVPIHGVIENGLGFYNEDKLTPFVNHLTSNGYKTGLIGKAGFNPIPHLGFTHLNILGEGGEDRENNVDKDNYLETYLVNCSMEFILERNRLDKLNDPWFLHLSMMSPHPPNTIPLGWEHRYPLSNGTSRGIDKKYEKNGDRFTYVDYDKSTDFVHLPTQTKYLQGMKELMPNEAALRALGLSLNDSSVIEQSQHASPILPTKKWMAASRAFPLNLMGDPDLKVISSVRYNYYNQVAFVDDQIGRLLSFLDEEMQLKERLLVIFTSDHGACLHDHGIPDKHTLIGEAPRVPLILRWPQRIRPGTTTNMASLIDVTATILSAAQIPNHQWKEVAGFSLVPATFTTSSSTTKTINRTAVAITDFLGYGVVTSKWKLFYYPQYDETFLFHRKSDPHDRLNRYHHSSDSFGNQQKIGKQKCEEDDDEGETPLPDLMEENAGNALLYALLRWRARQKIPGASVAEWGVSAEYGLMEDLRCF